jgi:pimeloyl-ACP methyl ester carboxylesterase
MLTCHGCRRRQVSEYNRDGATRLGSHSVLGAGRDRRPRDPAGRAAALAQHAQAHIVKVDAPHLSMISHPVAVTRLIVAAARGTSRRDSESSW